MATAAGATARASGLAGKIAGLRAAKAAFQALPEIVRDAMLDAVRTTASEIARNAQARLLASPSIDTRALYNSVAWSVTKTNGRGRVGVTAGSSRVSSGGRTRRIKGVLIAGKGGSALTSQGAKLKRPTTYAHLVEFGSRSMPAEPFMKPAAKAEESAFVSRCQSAGKGIEKNVAAIGMRGD